MGFYDSPTTEDTPQTSTKSGSDFYGPAIAKPTVESAIGGLFDKVKDFLGGSLAPKTTLNPLQTTIAPPTTSNASNFYDSPVQTQSPQQALNILKEKIAPKIPDTNPDVSNGGPFNTTPAENVVLQKLDTIGNNVQEGVEHPKVLLQRLEAITPTPQEAGLLMDPNTPKDQKTALENKFLNATSGFIGGEDLVAKNLGGNKIPQAVLSYFSKETNPDVISESIQNAYKIPKEIADDLGKKLAATKSVDEVKDVLTGKATAPIKTVQPEEIQAIAESVKNNPVPSEPKTQFKSPQIRDLKPEEQVSLQKVNAVLNGTSKTEIIAHTPDFVSNDGKERPLVFSSEIANKIKSHGNLIPENLVLNANDWDYAIKNVDGNPDKINLIKKIPNSDNFLVIGANRDNGYFTVTHFEYSSKNGQELKNLLQNKGDALDKFGRTPESTTPVSKEIADSVGSSAKPITVFKPDNQSIPETTDKSSESALTTEARKYESAEEFVKSQGSPLYHGTNAQFDAFDIEKAGTGEGSNKIGRGVYLTSDTNKANEYGKNTIEAYLKPDAKIVEWHSMKHDPRYNAFFDENEKAYKEKYGMGVGDNNNWLDHIKEDFAKKYFDAVTYGDKEIMVLNPDAVKTKSQLTDIYNKAVGDKSNLKTSNSTYSDAITPEEAQKKISELFDDHEVQLITGEDLDVLAKKGDTKTILQGFHQPKRVIADLIGLVERNGKVSNATLYHESFHAYLDNFVSPAEKARVINHIIETKEDVIRAKYSDADYPTLEEKAEEYAADGLSDFVKTGKTDPKLRNFFQRIIDRIRKWIRGIGDLDDLYDRVLEKDRSTVNPKAEAKKPSLSVEDERTPQEILADAEAKAANGDKQSDRLAKLNELVQSSKSHQGFMDKVLNDPAFSDIIPKLDKDLQDNGYHNFTDYYAKTKVLSKGTPTGNRTPALPNKATITPKTPAPIKKIAVPNSKITIPTETKERKEQFQMLVDNLKDRLADHPGKKLQQFISKKEGVFEDFKNPDLANTPSERTRIEKRNAAIIQASKSALQETPLHDQFDNPDVIREQIAEYQGLKTDLKDIQDAQGAFTKALQGKILDEKDKIALDNLAKRGAATEFPLSLSDVTPPTVRGGIQAPKLNFAAFKDIAAIRQSRDTFERNVEKIAPPEDAKKINDFLTKHVLQNELDRTKYSNALKLQNRELMQKLGIKRNSKEDSLIQLYGEKMIDLAQLQQASPEKWQAIKQAAEHDRNLYDDMLDKWNEVRAKYGYPPIPKRTDYFRHFNEIGFFTKNYGFLSSKDQLPTELAGKTEFFKPGKPFTTAELSRTGNQTKYSAIGGLDNYIDAVSKQIFHIDSIQRGRAFERYLEESAKYAANTPEKLKLANFATNLREYVNSGLAGKVAAIDRSIENYIGRPAIKAVQNISSLIGKNIIAGNISVAMTHLITLPINVATTDKVPFTKGLIDTLTSPFHKEPFNIIDGQESSFLTRRFPIESILPTNLDKVQNVLSYLFQAADQFKSRLAVAGKYYEGIDNGLAPKDAMEKADNYARRLVGDYSIGQRPNILNAKTMRLFAQFQLGLNDSLSVLVHDIPESARSMEEQPDGTFKETKSKGKIIGKLVQWAIYAYLFNIAYKKLRGSGKGLDPIGFVATLLGVTKDTAGMGFGVRAGKGLTDLGGELPFSSTVLGTFPLKTALTDITKFASDALTGKLTGKETGQVASEFLSPVGGGLQAKKTIQGIQSIKQGEATTVGQKIKALIFGPASLTDSVVSNKLNTYLQTTKNKVKTYDSDEVAKVQKIHDQVAKVGFGTTEGDALIADLSDNEYTIFKAMRTVDKAQDAIDLESKVLPIAKQANDLGFGTPEADKLIADSFPDTPEGDREYAAYQTIKNNLYGKNAVNEDGSGPIEGTWDKQSLVQHVVNIAKAVGTDPITAFKDIFAGNSSWKITGITNGQIMVNRMSLAESQATKKKQGADTTKFKLDHSVSLEAGGNNGAPNLQILPTGDVNTPGTWAWNSPTEDLIGSALKAGRINGSQAREYMIRFKATAKEPLSDALQKEFKDKYNSQPLTPAQIEDLVK